MSLLLFEQDAVFQKNLAFDNETWELTPDGLRALDGDGALTIARDRFNQDFLANKTTAVYLLVAAGSQVPGRISALSAFQEVQLTPYRVEPQPWGSAVVSYKLPRPMDVDALFVPNGTVLRGAYFGLL
ncbi:MAG: hypothetical protein HYT80_02850 [Euryarchaeota archaeon]|nr:hypothetical protein [Euryarchaeota archaeon]